MVEIFWEYDGQDDEWITKQQHTNDDNVIWLSNQIPSGVNVWFMQAGGIAATKYRIKNERENK